MASGNVKVSAYEKTLWSIAALTDNSSAYGRLKRELRVGDGAVNALMERARAAGRELAMEEGQQSVVERFKIGLYPSNQRVGEYGETANGQQ